MFRIIHRWRDRGRRLIEAWPERTTVLHYHVRLDGRQVAESIKRHGGGES